MATCDGWASAHPDTNLVLPKEVYWYLDDTSLARQHGDRG